MELLWCQWSNSVAVGKLLIWLHSLWYCWQSWKTPVRGLAVFSGGYWNPHSSCWYMPESKCKCQWGMLVTAIYSGYWERANLDFTHCFCGMFSRLCCVMCFVLSSYHLLSQQPGESAAEAILHWDSAYSQLWKQSVSAVQRPHIRSIWKI